MGSGATDAEDPRGGPGGPCRPVACALALVRGLAHVWTQAAALGLVGSVVLPADSPRASALPGLLLAGVIGLGFAPTHTPRGRAAARACAWARLAAGCAAVAAWVSAGDGPPARCLALAAAYAATVALADDVHPLFAAPRPLFLVSLGTLAGGFAAGASARFWRAGDLGAAALSAALVAGLGASSARGRLAAACPAHRPGVAADGDAPAGPGSPPDAARDPEGPAGRRVGPEHIWIPLATFLVAAALAAEFARVHPAWARSGAPRLWLQVFVLGHAAAGLTELLGALTARDLATPLLGVHVVLLFANHLASLFAPGPALYAMLGIAVWSSLAQVLGLHRRIREGGAGAGGYAPAAVRGLFLSVYALGLAVGTAVLVPRGNARAQ
ncbi:envelope protein UL43 [Macacine alphaherpesvirus 1]|uniref:Envelope protein UL43 n=1 Tax=Macacine alphaherpesvirus 2 TaxID=2845554 RepID=A0A1X9WF41_9ALPH|nr:envelope protein UL43 [Macacine alphaherpesvirus 1]ARS01681.1 envelope protein UL43 [Macacine alphaherpesvirus 2]